MRNLIWIAALAGLMVGCKSIELIEVKCTESVKSEIAKNKIQPVYEYTDQFVSDVRLLKKDGLIGDFVNVDEETCLYVKDYKQKSK